MEFTTEYQQRLMEAFHFDESDLVVNRTGRVRAAQIKTAFSDRTNWNITTVLILAGAIGLYMLQPLLQQHQPLHEYDPDPILVFLLYIGLLALVLVMFIGLPFTLDRLVRQCRVVEGQVTHKDMGKYCQITVQQTRFRVTDLQDYALEEGKAYRLYYLRFYRVIISAELV